MRNCCAAVVGECSIRNSKKSEEKRTKVQTQKQQLKNLSKGSTEKAEYRLYHLNQYEQLFQCGLIYGHVENPFFVIASIT